MLKISDRIIKIRLRCSILNLINTNLNGVEASGIQNIIFDLKAFFFLDRLKFYVYVYVNPIPRRGGLK